MTGLVTPIGSMSLPPVPPPAPPSALPAPHGDDYEALLQFLYLAPVGLVQIGRSGEIAMLNPLSSRLLMPLAREGDLTNLFTALEGVAPDLRHRVAAFEAPYGLVCDAMRLPISTRGTAQAPGPQTLSLSLLKLDATRLMAVLADITDQVRRERLLRQNEAWLYAILNDIRDYCVVGLDRAGRIDDWDPSIGRVTGFSREQVIGQPYAIFYPEGAATAERMRDLLQEADDNGWSFDDGWRVRADGSRFWGSTLISPLSERSRATVSERSRSPLSERSRPTVGERSRLEPREPGEAALPAASGYRLVIRDINDEREASEGHRRAHACDHLTGLANRSAFFEAGELELARARRSRGELSLILVDADHFRQVNETHGHPAGDAVLQHLATVLTDTFRTVDLVARIGGEEFAVLLPSSGLESAVDGAERLRQAVQARPVEVSGQAIRCTVSAGVAIGPGDSLALDDLIKLADAALRRAKAGGRDQVAWSAPA